MLSEQYELFCQEYVVDFNATQAYIRAGYSENGAGQSGARLLKNAEIYARIEELQKEKLERVQVNQDWVILRLMQVSDRCMQAEEVMKWDFEAKSMVGTGEYQFDSNGANKSTELIGKHLGMFKEKVDMTVTNEIDVNKLTPEERLQYLRLFKKARS